MEEHSNLISESVEVIQSVYSGMFPKIAIILGSGLGDFGKEIDVQCELDYSDLPAFPNATVSGHSGKLLMGKAGGVDVVCMQGRMHLYEGHHPSELALPIRTLRKLGAETLFVTNACGALRTDFPPGTLVALEDHINMSGFNPLIGPNDDKIGPRFIDLSNAWDRDLRKELHAAAKEAQVDLKSGIYVQYSGPNFETPAEIRMFRQLGGDLIGMSTVPECLVANHCGMRVVGVSVVTNLAAGIADHGLSHTQTIAVANHAYDKMSRILIQFLQRI